MSSFFQEEGGGLAGKHPAYIRRHNLDDLALRKAVEGSLLQVVAPRQVGKTSLLQHLREHLREQGWRCAIVDLATLLTLPMAAWYEALGQQLVAELTPGFSLTLTNHLTLFTYLTGEAMNERYGSQRVAVFFDAVENACRVQDEHGKPFSDAFFSTIRSYYDNHPSKTNLTIALASAVSPRHLITDERISPFNVGFPLNLDDFTLVETRTLTRHLEQLPVSIDEAAHSEIYTWTHGHPYLTTCICGELTRRVSGQGLNAISAESVRQVVQALFLAVRYPQLVNSNLRHADRILTQLTPPIKTIWEQIRQGKPWLIASVDKETLEDFYLTGVIATSQDGHLVIRNQVYREIFQAAEVPAQASVSLEQTATVLDTKGQKTDHKQRGQAPEAASQPATHNPWKTGMFYLVAFVVIIAVLFVAVRYLPWYAVPLLLAAAIVALIVIGSFGLVGDVLPVKNFMEVMRLVFKFLPNLLHGDNTQPDAPKRAAKK